MDSITLERRYAIIESFRNKMLEKYNVDGQIRIPESKVMHELYCEFGEPILRMSDHDTLFDHLTIDSDLKFSEEEISCADVFSRQEVIPETAVTNALRKALS